MVFTDLFQNPNVRITDTGKDCSVYLRITPELEWEQWFKASDSVRNLVLFDRVEVSGCELTRMTGRRLHADSGKYILDNDSVFLSVGIYVRNDFYFWRGRAFDELAGLPLRPLVSRRVQWNFDRSKKSRQLLDLDKQTEVYIPSQPVQIKDVLRM